MKNFKSPANKKEYWQLVNTNWDGLQKLFDLYLPTFNSKWIDGSAIDKPLRDFLIDLKVSENPRLARAINAALWNCPEDHSGEWHHPSWHAISVIASHDWVLIEEREDFESFEET